MENWKKTRISEYYEVSDSGLVKSIDRYVDSKGGSKRLTRGRMLRFTEDKDGYYQVGIHFNGEQHTKFVHQLVAETFIPNPDNKPCIDHINGDRTDNRVENLRWCTVGENNAFELARQAKSKSARLRQDNKKPIVQITLDGEIVKIWECACRIEEELGFDRSSIIRVCKGKQATSYGFKWKYYD